MIINITTFDLLLGKRGLTQAALAQRARLGTKTIGRIRRGKELRISNAQKIAEELGVSLDELQLPPSETLKQDWGKKGGRNRLVADLGSQALNALTLTSLRYKIPEKTIIEAGPYMFTILAELSLKRRRDKLETWKDAALAAVEQGPRREWPTIETITTDIWELYDEELASIEKRDLSGGFEGDRELIEAAAGCEESSIDKSPDHAFFMFIESLAEECGYADDVMTEWYWVSSENMLPNSFLPHKHTISEFFDPENENRIFHPDISTLLGVFHGDILLKDMPEDLFFSGTGPERRAWAMSHPNHPDREEFLRQIASNEAANQSNALLSGGPNA
jgi:transcriptional regulator with XRE-family HTH domain